MSQPQRIPRSEEAQRAEVDATPIEDRNLRIELEIERGGPCVMDGIAGEVTSVDVRFEGPDCRVDLDHRKQTSDGPQMSTKQFSSNVCEHCPGVVFHRYGCIPRYLEVGDGWFTIETYVDTTETVTALVQDVRECCDRVMLRSITSTDQQEYAENCTIDLSSLTPKQREAVSLAKELGYYDPDSSVELDDIANEMGISSSALSQRLQRAKANVFRQLTTECDCW